MNDEQSHEHRKGQSKQQQKKGSEAYVNANGEKSRRQQVWSISPTRNPPPTDVDARNTSSAYKTSVGQERLKKN